MDNPRRLILASGSRYRKELLARLGLPFEVEIPNVDESPQPQESPADTALRLCVSGQGRAGVPARRPDHRLGPGGLSSQFGIASDKPGEPRSTAARQLRELSGRKTAQFDTAVALLDGPKWRACRPEWSPAASLSARGR